MSNQDQKKYDEKSLNKKRGAILISFNGETRAVAITQKEFDIVLDLLFLVHNGTLKVCKTDYKQIVLSDLATKHSN